MTLKIEKLYFANKIRFYLFENDLKQSDILAKLNENSEKKIAQQQFQRWTTGEVMPSPKIIRQLCDIFDVDAEYFDFEKRTEEDSRFFKKYLRSKIDKEEYNLTQKYENEMNELKKIKEFL